MGAKVFLSAIIAASCVVLAGCGGGGGSSTAATELAASLDRKVIVQGQAAAVPTGVSLVVQSKTAAELPDEPVGPAFVAGASCGPSGTTFSQAVTLVFKLEPPALNPGTEVRLYAYNATGVPVDTGVRAALSADGLTATVVLTQFNADAANPYYMLVR